MQYVNGGIRFSPSDLTRFLESEYSTWMDRWYLERQHGHHDQAFPAGFEVSGIERCEPDDTDEEMEIIATKGIEHEAEFLDSLKRDGKQIAEIPSKSDSIALTHDALAHGDEIIFQAHLVFENIGGYADFLVRKPGRSKLGDYHYEVWDTKLAKSPKPHFLVQLCAYADLLDAIQGRRPDGFEVILGVKEEDGASKQLRFETDRYFYYYRALKDAFLDFHDGFDIGEPPHPGLSKSHGQWSEFASLVLEQADHLSKVASITRVQIKKLEEAGIETLEGLANTEVDHVAKLATQSFTKLKNQARLQFQSIGKQKPLFELIPLVDESPRQGLQLLPPASAHDVFFDIEGFPLHEGGLEYLFGAIRLHNGAPNFVDWWAHDTKQEKQAFDEFVDWIHARWQANPGLHIYHFASYEVTTIKRLMQQFASRESKVDDLLRNQVFVDLYKVVRQGLVLGTPSYSLKEVERLYMEDREGAVTTSGGSIVAYHNWIESGQSEDWRQSAILKEIRDYNEVDCISTLKLAEYLRKLQVKSGITFVEQEKDSPKNNNTDKGNPNEAASKLAEKLQAKLESDAVEDDERRRVQQLLSWLVEFHWREARPVFWRKFAREGMTESELIDDFDCLGGLRRTDNPPQPIKRSHLYQFEYDANQDSKLHKGSKCFFSHDLSVRTSIEEFDNDQGVVEIKLGPSAGNPPTRLNLIPDEFVSAQSIADAVYRYVEAWSNGTSISSAVDDLIHRRQPRIKNHSGGSIVDESTPLVPATVDAIQRMDGTLLCVQGPPGTGKTYAAANAILQLLNDGKKIAVTANGHKAILNLLKDAYKEISKAGLEFQMLKVGGDPEDPILDQCEIDYVELSRDVAGLLIDGPMVVGGTAWVFSRPELAGRFDYLIVDEAGQFSLANVVATGCSAKNVVLVGDQMQLSQPTLGAHPGESGKSALEYYLAGHQTIPPDFGILLDQSRRMHPDVCDFISEAIYESRLHSHPNTRKQRIELENSDDNLIEKAAGIQFIPVAHESNSQSSSEEVDVIARIHRELVGRPYVDFDGEGHDELTINDILVVAPFNMQVRMLQHRLGHHARVGTVDKFQGQQAPVVIISMTSSSLDDAPRGADFLLDPNRLNVAISRAKSLAIVVGSPEIAQAKCRTIKEMELANLFCRLIDYSQNPSSRGALPDPHYLAESRSQAGQRLDTHD